MAMLSRDKKWEMFYGDISLEQFVSEKLPAYVFKKDVSKDVVESFGVVHQLLIHSYYQYLFVDVAVTKALHIFEMALWIRYKELNNGEEWDLTKKTLTKLIDWFNGRSYFEISSKDFLDHVRDTRNYLTHPKGFHFAGATGLHWINTTVDLINNLYENIELRRERWRSTSENKAKFNLFLKNGAKLTFQDKVYYIYKNGPLKVENRLDQNACYFSLLPLFEVESTTPKEPFVFGYPLDKINFNNSTIELSFNSDKLKLTNHLNHNEVDLISKFKEKVNNEEAYKVHDSMLIFDSENIINRALGESLNFKIMQEYELTVEIKNIVTVERNKDQTPPFS